MICPALAYSAKSILVPKGLRCPFASSAESRIIRASLYKPSKQNKTRKNTQLAKTGWLDTRFLISPKELADKPRYLVESAKQLIFWFCLSDFGGRMIAGYSMLDARYSIPDTRCLAGMVWELSIHFCGFDVDFFLSFCYIMT